MTKIANPANTIDIIKKYDFNFQKKFGQNFLIDTHVLDKICSESGLGKNDLAIEIGPGIGALTQYLAVTAKAVVSVEIDKNLLPILGDTLKDYKNIELINADFLKVDLEKLIDECIQKYGEFDNIRIIANLPYYITTPIIMNVLESHTHIDSITVMIQKEVADRMQAAPGSKNYGALSLAVQYYSDPYVVAFVPQNCFIPRPKVGSSVIRLDIYKDKPIKTVNEKLMFQIIRAGFNQRRKTLVNSLINFEGLQFSKNKIIHALSLLGKSEKIRGEALSLDEFAQLAEYLQE
ncbi:dimethyladenosine transferase [Lachnoanaerobaculum saburreum F0468]|uniref:Ribosomal RNA small subunit methyltransferase A n=1 Tax=Lachnoanaerobaculum saburreum F0468 TaxID=1095750 RepID=I0R7I1_9FIRM|nr:16S rRNA (adenine(1518)-N(6)/adenine(1519)-N(6))-dimethyltransferase RsmA [Lachnoanaerobaculum saburreum]EIC95639.1 dimethyladenosine transferase [Lachnoanaerobaculum saburreum F0468]